MENQTSTNHLTTAIALIRAGSKDEARQQLVHLLRANPRDEAAWLWLVETLTTREERIRALETCLQFIPHSEAVRRGLAALNAAQPAAEPVVRDEPTTAPQGRENVIAAGVCLGLWHSSCCLRCRPLPWCGLSRDPRVPVQRKRSLSRVNRFKRCCRPILMQKPHPSPAAICSFRGR